MLAVECAAGRDAAQCAGDAGRPKGKPAESGQTPDSDAMPADEDKPAESSETETKPEGDEPEETVPEEKPSAEKPSAEKPADPPDEPEEPLPDPIKPPPVPVPVRVPAAVIARVEGDVLKGRVESLKELARQLHELARR